jgi:hypothetical protein
MDFPQARIITFGYDINIIRFAKDWGRGSDDSLRTYGRDLAYAIRNILQQLQAHPSRPRPIYFIAHSLGGLVVEQALLESLGPDESLSIIARLAAGILFFGVPHQAFHLVKWGSALTELIPQSIRDTNKKVLDALEKDSNVCRNVDRDFQRETNHGRLKKIMIFSFYETEKLPGFANLVVPRESAVLTAESSCPINGDHMSITRFSGRDDPDYAKVKGQLTHWLSLSTVRLIGKDTVFINETDFEDFEEYDDDANIDEEGLSIGKSSKGKEKPPTATHSEDEEASDTGLESADSKTDGTTVPDSAQTAETSPKSYGLKVLFSPAEPALAIAE